MIEVRDLHKSYGDVHALRGVSFQVERGEVVGLLGPNGAGKSTAMRIITGYLAPDAGTATVMGDDVVNDPVAAQRHIGYLPEGNPLYRELRLIEALRYQAQLRGIRGAARDKAARAAMEATGLGGMAYFKIGTLSRGYRQRVGLAQALIHEPPVLILDEPSSGLDPNQQREMRLLLQRLGERAAVIFSTHILPEVDHVCDRALVIAGGRLVAEGATADVVALAGLGGRLVVTVSGDDGPARTAVESLPFVTSVETEVVAGHTNIAASVARAVGEDELRHAASTLTGAGLTYWGLGSAGANLEQAFSALTERLQAEADVEVLEEIRPDVEDTEVERKAAGDASETDPAPDPDAPAATESSDELAEEA